MPSLLTALKLKFQTAPSTPASGEILVYAKSDKKIYTKDEDGTETELGSGTGGGIESADITDIVFIPGEDWAILSPPDATTLYFLEGDPGESYAIALGSTVINLAPVMEANIAAIMADYVSGSTVRHIELMTQAEYDAYVGVDPTWLVFVTDGDNNVYLGDDLIMTLGGGGPGGGDPTLKAIYYSTNLCYFR